MEQGHVNAGFDQWVVFEKARAANRMHHREAYDTIARAFAGFENPPRILDLGCGDGRDIANIIKRNPAAEYVGIDNSIEALDQARTNLAELECPGRLLYADYTEAFKLDSASFDIILLGLFLHHLPEEEKRDFFQQAARLLSPQGLVLAHDPVLLETEEREEFLERIARACQGWPELNAPEKEVLARHWSRHGRQERISRLQEMAGRAGLSRTTILWRDPERFYVVMAFQR